MTFFLEVDHVDRNFPLPDGGEYIALKNIQLPIRQGEFICLVGHSGCGKSTLLNILSGLDQPTRGGVILEGRQVTDPGPDRMVVFQNYSLLPWLTVRQNIALAVNQVMKQYSQTERHRIIDAHIQLVGLQKAAHKRPSQLSGGMKQRVAIARALSIRPKLLLLDEPFGALDVLTRGGLQEQLMEICQQNQVTCVMVTHDVDEALLLADRIVLMTNGPSSHIGRIIEVPFPRPREHLSVVKHPNYYGLRNEVVYFLTQQKKSKLRQLSSTTVITANGLEKVNLELGYIPLSDCAPLVVAKQLGLFEHYGLSQVTLNREPSWNAIADGISSGRLDAAMMVAGMPLALTLGLGLPQPLPVVSGMTLSRNGNAITLSRSLYESGVHNVSNLKAALAKRSDQAFTLAAVHPASMQHLLLRYWLASGGIDPDRDVTVTMVPPAQMVSTLRSGAIDGYCVGEPWNSRAVHDQIGVVVATDRDLWPGHIEKVLGVTETWAEQYPKTHLALVKALLAACEYCDQPQNREQILEWLCYPEYVGSDQIYTCRGWIAPYYRGDGQRPQVIPNFNQFFYRKTNCPDVTETLWIMTQMARWGMTPFPKNWLELTERLNRTDVFGQAARDMDLVDIGRDRQSFRLFDNVIFYPDQPLEYLQNFEIKRPLQVEEVLI